MALIIIFEKLETGTKRLCGNAVGESQFFSHPIPIPPRNFLQPRITTAFSLQLGLLTMLLPASECPGTEMECYDHLDSGGYRARLQNLLAAPLYNGKSAVYDLRGGQFSLFCINHPTYGALVLSMLVSTVSSDQTHEVFSYHTSLVLGEYSSTVWIPKEKLRMMIVLSDLHNVAS
ncbi:hypothetical protein OUZ56_002147 [Daphnia magna]|uniref:Uncharacterized protein n=1 Tax=Daphnia magna TaxID=35525 RepID=A0ABR0A4T6_9CRUS|nr:hypothetical protein OUZ56_002147 [Daphnia magna]